MARVDAAPTRPAPGSIAVAAWLLGCAALVFAIIVVGGATRLTRSGLSIVEWKPIAGTLPPLSQADWDDAFAKYRETPEYRLVNRGMTLDGFKRIFWWEWAHRLLGRIIGLAYLVPLLWFLARRQVPAGYGGRLAAIFLLGGLQGALGWFMVKSGLVDNPQVSHFRLTAHLGLAVLILGAMLWTALSLLYPQRAPDRHARRVARRWSAVVVALVAGMILTGGLVAGFRAGYAYNTWPLMNGRLVPPELLHLEPAWRNALWNMATIQFNHRMVAYLLVGAVGMLWWRLWRDAAVLPARARLSGHALAIMVAVQVTLGIATLLLVVPIALATLHQAVAILVLALALNVAHALR